LHRTRGKGSALPTDPPERGGPPPLLGLSPGLCGPGGTIAHFTYRTVSLLIKGGTAMACMSKKPAKAGKSSCGPVKAKAAKKK
jgi:hypothetical protein